VREILDEDRPQPAHIEQALDQILETEAPFLDPLEPVDAEAERLSLAASGLIAALVNDRFIGFKRHQDHSAQETG
jgi:hypothetical protein